MKNLIYRDDVEMIIDMKSISKNNRLYLTEMLIHKKVLGVTDLNTAIITKNYCYMVKASSINVMNKLNKLHFLKI